MRERVMCGGQVPPTRAFTFLNAPKPLEAGAVRQQVAFFTRSLCSRSQVYTGGRINPEACARRLGEDAGQGAGA